jgi:hypothetical protein
MPEHNCTSDDPSAALDPNETRTRPRRLCGRIVLVRPRGTTETAFRPTSLWDISADGIGLFLARPCEPGAVLEVRFRHPAIADRQARVVHTVGKPGGWQVGCLLDRPFDENESKVLELLEPVPTPGVGAQGTTPGG